MTKPEFVHFTLEEQDGIGIFTIHRPEVLNAMNPDAFQDIGKFVEYLNESDLKVGIITGEGEKSFIAGADIKATVGLVPSDVFLKDRPLPNATRAMEKCRKPIIAAINGYALGGGMEVALACDIRILSENAMMGLPETNLGTIPGSGGTQRLTKIAGVGIAKQLILTGKPLKAEECVRANLAMKVVPLEKLMPEAIKIAKKIAQRGPYANMLAKRVIEMSADIDIEDGMFAEAMAYALTIASEDRKEGFAAFIEKRDPKFIGK